MADPYDVLDASRSDALLDQAVDAIAADERLALAKKLGSSSRTRAERREFAIDALIDKVET